MMMEFIFIVFSLALLDNIKYELPDLDICDLENLKFIKSMTQKEYKILIIYFHYIYYLKISEIYFK